MNAFRRLLEYLNDSRVITAAVLIVAAAGGALVLRTLDDVVRRVPTPQEREREPGQPTIHKTQLGLVTSMASKTDAAEAVATVLCADLVDAPEGHAACMAGERRTFEFERYCEQGDNEVARGARFTTTDAQLAGIIAAFETLQGDGELVFYLEHAGDASYRAWLAAGPGVEGVGTLPALHRCPEGEP